MSISICVQYVNRNQAFFIQKNHKSQAIKMPIMELQSLKIPTFKVLIEYEDQTRL